MPQLSEIDPGTLYDQTLSTLSILHYGQLSSGMVDKIPFIIDCGTIWKMVSGRGEGYSHDIPTSPL